MLRLPQMLVLLAAAGAACAQTAEPRIWAGAFTTAQADRGKAAFMQHCSNCHNQDLAGSARAPALKGGTFMKNWENGSVNNLFTKIRFSMPATYPETVSDEVKLDIVTYLLEQNGFPAGASELKMSEEELEDVQIAAKGNGTIPNFALVQIVGCLAQGSKNTWTLSQASAPVVTRDETTSPAALKEAAAKPPGELNFLLISVAVFNPAPHAGQRMEARGLLYRDPSGNRINLTSLETVAPACGK
jgi:mono/diheme cytochrome c family protein